MCKQNLIYRWLGTSIGMGAVGWSGVLQHWFHGCSVLRKRIRLCEYFCFKAKSHIGWDGEMRVARFCLCCVNERKSVCVFCVFELPSEKKGDSISHLHILFVTAMSSIWYFVPLSLDEQNCEIFVPCDRLTIEKKIQWKRMSFRFLDKCSRKTSITEFVNEKRERKKNTQMISI